MSVICDIITLKKKKKTYLVYWTPQVGRTIPGGVCCVGLWAVNVSLAALYKSFSGNSRAYQFVSTEEGF